MKNIEGGPDVIGGNNLPSLVRIGLTDLQNIGGGGSGLPGPPGSGTTELRKVTFVVNYFVGT